MKRGMTLILIAAMCLGLLGGCGGTAPAAEATSAPTAAPTPAAEEAPAESVDTTPELVRVATAEPVDLDPVSITSQNKSCLLEIYEPLFTTESRGGELVAVLADSGKGALGGYDHTAGTAVYSVFVRQGVADHQGNAFTASDAAFCYQRAAEALGWTVWSRAEAVAGDQLDLTFTRELTGPGELRQYLCDVYMYTEAAYNAQNGLTAAACGTGPYSFDHFTPGTELVANRWADYVQQRTPLARSAANVKSIRYIFPKSAAEGVIALETGRADMADCLDYADTEDFRGEGVYTDLFRLQASWSAVNDILVPNMAHDGMMDDQNLRLGIFYAIDGAWAAESFGEGGGRACLAVGNPDYPDIPQSWQDADSYQTKALDVDGARSYLRQAYYVNEAINLLVTKGSSAEQLGIMIQTKLRPWSITINVVAADAETFAQTLAAQKGWDLAIVSVEAQTSVAEVWKKLWLDNVTNGYYVGMLRDSALTQRLTAVSTESGCTEENLTAVMDYVTEKAYAMALSQKCRPAVVPAELPGVYLTGRGELLPGACIFSE